MLKLFAPATWRDAIDTSPKSHIAAVASVSLVLATVFGVLPDNDEASPSRPTYELSELYVVIESRENFFEALDAAEEGLTQELEWRTQVVTSGDNLTSIFRRAGLGLSDVHAVIDPNPDARSQLARIRPGQEMHFGFDDQEQLQQLRYERSALEALVVNRHENTYIASIELREPDVLTTYREGVISSSLFVSGQNAGLPHQVIMDLATIFGWDIDFALDIREGDYFTVTYEEKMVDGKQAGVGTILAATFSNRGNVYRTVRYVDQDGEARYYTPDGMSMRRAFLRTPVDFTRISSNFNMRRLHPITKTVRPHRGIDYAAPTGTPVYSAGDGRVLASGFTNANGNYVVIQHGERYTTKYLHLHRRSVKVGDRVTQGNQIGTVGATGLATGPHLHYEFLIDGVHTDPRTIQLPEAMPIASEERTRFLRQTRPLVQQLAAFTAESSQIELASLDILGNEG